MPSKQETVTSFIAAAPPGQLQNVVDDIKALTVDEPQLTQNLTPAFQKYHEAQFTTVPHPDSNELVVISPHNSLGSNRYYDLSSSTAFQFDPASLKVSSVQSHTPESSHTDLAQSLNRSLAKYVKEHYPKAAIGVFPTSSAIALLISAPKYSLNNFWAGQWRSSYFLDSSSGNLKGTIKVDVHYFEDGNVRMQTEKNVEIKAGTGAEDVVKAIAAAEKKYQEELNKGFSGLNEGVFRGLRRQLPVTRQRVEWDKVGAYRLGQDIGGGRSR